MILRISYYGKTTEISSPSPRELIQSKPLIWRRKLRGWLIRLVYGGDPLLCRWGDRMRITGLIGTTCTSEGKEQEKPRGRSTLFL